MTLALISPEVLRWARERSNTDPEKLAKKARVSVEKIDLWERGTEKPTFKQAQKLANILHIPFGYFFLSKPPEIALPLPDLRTISDNKLDHFSIDLQDVISDVLRKQDWYRDYLKEQGVKPLPFIGKYNIDEPIEIVANDISDTIGLDLKSREEVSNWEDFLRLLMVLVEDAGVSVMRNGKVISNTHRTLDVEEFRGFTISDPIAPIIFINGADAKAAQIFTLIHELAHLWLGQSGVSIISIDPSEHGEPREIERICNEIAAEVLVPEALFKTKWDRKDSIDENSKKQAKYFRVSPVVVARRAWDLKLISSDNFFNYYNSQRKKWRLLKEKRKGGADYYSNLLMMNGRDISQAILESVYSQNMLIRNGARLLGAKPHNLDEFARREGVL